MDHHQFMYNTIDYNNRMLASVSGSHQFSADNYEDWVKSYEESGDPELLRLYHASGNQDYLNLYYETGDEKYMTMYDASKSIEALEAFNATTDPVYRDLVKSSAKILFMTSDHIAELNDRLDSKESRYLGY